MRGWLSAAAWAAAAAAALPAAAQQPASPWLPLPRPADTGKPLTYAPQSQLQDESEQPAGCAVLLRCRFRLLGVIQNNGAVELRATAFSW